MSSAPANAPVPVTVLTGFLGSGKTTLLNRILTERHGKRIAVIENEFGEIGIDHDLVVGADEEVFEMSNGCICCTVRGDLIRVLGNLFKRRDRFDHILVETTGLADPGPVAQTFFVDDEIRSRSTLDGIVTLVDVRNFLQHVGDRSGEALAQVAFADSIVLNKCDLVSEEDVVAVERAVREINAQATITRAVDAAVPLERILDLGGFDLERAQEIKPTFLEPEYPFERIAVFELPAGAHTLDIAPGPDPTMMLGAFPLASHGDDALDRLTQLAVQAFAERPRTAPGTRLVADGSVAELDVTAGGTWPLLVPRHGFVAILTQHLPEEFALRLLVDGEAVAPLRERTLAARHEHDRSVSSVGLTSRRALDSEQLGTWLGELVRERGVDLFRIKGVIDVAGDENRWVVQGVHMLMRSQQDRPWGDDVRETRLVLIGRHLDRAELTAGFLACES